MSEPGAWKTELKLVDLHARYRTGEIGVPDLAKGLADQLVKNAYAPQLTAVIRRLKTVNTVKSYEACVKAVYFFGLFENRIWIDTGVGI